jgi:hypothetical protein
MFMCKECHKKDEEDGICSADHFEMTYALSFGKCELCGKLTDCVDCKAYKYIKPRSK